MGAPLPVRVHFSHAATEADDLILSMVAELGTDVPVVVVSTDRRVADRSAATGSECHPIEKLARARPAMSSSSPGDPAAATLSTRVLVAAHAAGLDRVGICDATPFEEVRAVLEERREAGLHGGMQFTYRNPARSTDPSRALPGARSMVVAAMGHPHDRPADGDVPTGRVARYATDDHYARLRAALQAVADVLVDEGHRAVVIADDNAMVDRAAAVRAGIGWYGKSSNVLLPGRGSWFLLGSVITDAPLDPNQEQVADGCGAVPDASTGARPQRSWRPAWWTPAVAWHGTSRSPASSPASSVSHWATGSTAATSARRSAHRTGEAPGR